MQSTVYSITDLCCICLKCGNHLRHFNTCENVNYYSRLVLLFPEMISTVLHNHGAICAECCSKVDDFYKFREQCLQNSQIYINHTRQLSSVPETSDEWTCSDLMNLKEEKKEFLESCDQSDKQYSNRPESDKTDCVTYETSEKYDNNSPRKTGREENGIDINDGASCDMHPDDTINTDIKKEMDIKTEYEVSDEHIVTAGWSNDSQDPLETNCTVATDMSQCYSYNYNTNIITEEIYIKSDFGNDGEYEESVTRQVTDIETSSSNSDGNCESKLIDKFKQTKSKLYECNKCEATFALAEYLAEHKRLHSEENPFQCDQCDKAFSGSSSLICHKRIHSGETPFKCDQCNKTFKQSGQLIRHKRIHSGEKPFMCEQCNKAFSQSADLIRHKRIHSGDKPFKCDHCGKAFSVSSNLNSHKRVHSGEKPYKCDQCDKAYSGSANLTAHKRRHSGEKPFKCDQCDKAFSVAANLITHKRLHSGEKPFKCEQCDKAFTYPQKLVKHKQIHSREEPLKC